MSRRAPNRRGLWIVEPASLAIKSRLAVVAWAWLILAPTRRNEEQLGAGLSGEAWGGSNPSLPAIPFAVIPASRSASLRSWDDQRDSGAASEQTPCRDSGRNPIERFSRPMPLPCRRWSSLQDWSGAHPHVATSHGRSASGSPRYHRLSLAQTPPMRRQLGFCFRDSRCPDSRAGSIPSGARLPRSRGRSRRGCRTRRHACLRSGCRGTESCPRLSGLIC
jgi:hypothetical protein